MFRLRRQCRTSFPQLAALGLLLLGLVIAPLMTALGDIHEATHAHASAHMHADATDAGADGHDDQDGEQHAGLLHSLMHSCHCQNHLATLASMAILSLPAAPSDARLGANTSANSQHVPDNLLRPPDRSMT